MNDELYDGVSERVGFRCDFWLRGLGAVLKGIGVWL